MNNPGQLDVIHPIAAGMDVHKKFLVAVVIDASDPLTKPKSYKRRFSLYKNDLEEMRDWLLSLNCKHVCMESTGVYWLPVYNILEEAMSEVRICNPKWLKLVKGEKDDSKDAAWICNQYRQGVTRASYIPPKNIRELRELTRLRKKYVQARTSDMNRLINVLTRNNYKLDMTFSSIHTLSASRIIDLILSKDEPTDKEILACVHPRCKASKEDILKAVDGIRMSANEKARMRIIQTSIQNFNRQIEALDKLIQEQTEEYAEELKLLQTIPGISKESARYILAEIGPDMTPFQTPAKFAKWAGLAPGSNESAGKKFSVHVTKGGKYLKPILVQCAWAAIKSRNPYFKLKFNAIKNRQGKKRALVAIARKMLVCIWAVLKNRTYWKPKDADEQFRPVDASIKAAKNRMATALLELTSLGISKEEISINFVTALNSLE